jgi:hypothetical protein
VLDQDAEGVLHILAKLVGDIEADLSGEHGVERYLLGLVQLLHVSQELILDGPISAQATSDGYLFAEEGHEQRAVVFKLLLSGRDRSLNAS